MIYRIASTAAKTTVPRKLAIIGLALALGPHALAQQRPARPPAQATPVPNAGQIQQGPPADAVQVIFSPWARYCAKGPTEQASEIATKEVCFTAADGHLASGQKLVIALLIEPEGSDTKLLRVTLPLGVSLVPGARVVIDEKDSMTAPYVVCQPKNGCMADYKADADLIGRLKNGQSLAIQAFDRAKPISFILPLTGFANAYDGPPSDPVGLNELRAGVSDDLGTRGGK